MFSIVADYEEILAGFLKDARGKELPVPGDLDPKSQRWGKRSIFCFGRFTCAVDLVALL
jgi:hypothetical protein